MWAGFSPFKHTWAGTGQLLGEGGLEKMVDTNFNAQFFFNFFLIKLLLF
jgi:hypothetical protein